MRCPPFRFRSAALIAILLPTVFLAAEPRFVSGIYPHLAMFNEEAECGIGAVVPWAGRLWVVTYAPHKPSGSTDKLYEITPGLEQIIRPESIGGTPANRMIHRESQQLFIGPYVIGANGLVRVIPYEKMFGRPTGNARHLFEPARKVYTATMEEGLYEVDVTTLAVTELWADEQKATGRQANLPGYHGKGLYSGQGRIIYANNGDHAREALSDPAVPSGALASWDGRAEQWTTVRRNQFTEITGPGGIYGNEYPNRDPVWTIGWDHRSLILMVLDRGQWHSYRLPKGSHSYDGAHGWNTEWPRIRDIGEDALLMTMHGTFWKFPKDFSPTHSAGLVPRGNYLKVVGDFAHWNDRVVLGCDDSAKSEFLNKRKAKGALAGPGKSQSNLWFIKPERLDQLGQALGRGAVWLDDAVEAGSASDPFLFSGYAKRSLHLSHDEALPVTFDLEVDVRGDGTWRYLRSITVPAFGGIWTEFSSKDKGSWVRLKANRDCGRAAAFFHYSAEDKRRQAPASMFASLAKPGETSVNGGLLLARGADFRTLRFIARNAEGELGGYDLDGDLTLRPANDPEGVAWTRTNAAIPHGVLTVDDASVLYSGEGGRWRLPRGDAAFDRPGVLGDERVCREVCTERDLFNAHGTFYELPAQNAGGFAKIRPVTTHNRRLKDYASYRGLLVVSGVANDAPAGEHIIRSDDGRCALWVGVVDDLWQLGKPRGVGGPWKNTAVKAGVPSDPFLMTGYDRKRVSVSHQATQPVTIRLEADVTGTGRWVAYKSLKVTPGKVVHHRFPDAFAAYWVRVVADRDCTATTTFVYE